MPIKKCYFGKDKKTLVHEALKNWRWQKILSRDMEFYKNVIKITLL